MEDKCGKKNWLQYIIFHFYLKNFPTRPKNLQLLKKLVLWYILTVILESIVLYP